MADSDHHSVDKVLIQKLFDRLQASLLLSQRLAAEAWAVHEEIAHATTTLQAIVRSKPKGGA